MAPYSIVVDPIEDFLKKLEKKNKNIYERVIKQIIKISSSPETGKPLRNIFSGLRRVHVGPFVLIYKIDETEKSVVFLKFGHHDEAYR